MAPVAPPVPTFEGHAPFLTAEPATQAFASRHAPSALGTLKPVAPPKPLPPPPGSGGARPRPGGILPKLKV